MAVVTRLSAAQLSRLLVPDDAVDRWLAEVEAAPDMTDEELGREALKFVRDNLLWLRHIIDQAGGPVGPNYPSGDAAAKRLEVARSLHLSACKLERARRK